MKAHAESGRSLLPVSFGVGGRLEPAAKPIFHVWRVGGGFGGRYGVVVANMEGWRKVGTL